MKMFQNNSSRVHQIVQKFKILPYKSQFLTLKSNKFSQNPLNTPANYHQSKQHYKSYLIKKMKNIKNHDI